MNDSLLDLIETTQSIENDLYVQEEELKELRRVHKQTKIELKESENELQKAIETELEINGIKIPNDKTSNIIRFNSDSMEKPILMVVNCDNCNDMAEKICQIIDTPDNLNEQSLTVSSFSYPLSKETPRFFNINDNRFSNKMNLDKLFSIKYGKNYHKIIAHSINKDEELSYNKKSKQIYNILNRRNEKTL